ncbi:MAG: hypothetical protein SFV81_05965 [Pirellulaceae bacterium]|nr:hypothetical protein [Pirellulaceae bacterium]
MLASNKKPFDGFQVSCKRDDGTWELVGTLDEVWAALHSVAWQATSFIGGFHLREDVQQELMTQIPSLLERWKGEGQFYNFYYTVLRREALRILNRNHAYKFTRSLQDVTNGELDDPMAGVIEPLLELECVNCGDVFIQRHGEQLTCGKQCLHSIKRLRESVGSIATELEITLGALKTGPCSDEKLRALLPGNPIERLTQLRAIGFEINATPEAFVLVSVPSGEISLARALMQFRISGEEVSCWNCDSKFMPSNRRRPSSFCSERCTGQFRRRVSKADDFCSVCGEAFTPKKLKQETCSRKCLVTLHNRRRCRTATS